MALSQKDIQLQSLQKEHLELMRQLTATQENLHTKEQAIGQLEARYQELEAQLSELQTDSNAKDDNIQFLQNEKIVLEVALQAARADKSQLDEGAERLGEDVLVASDVLDQLRQEVQVKTSQVGDGRETCFQGEPVIFLVIFSTNIIFYITEVDKQSTFSTFLFLSKEGGPDYRPDGD